MVRGHSEHTHATGVNRFNELLGSDWQHIANIHSCTHPIFINVVARVPCSMLALSLFLCVFPFILCALLCFALPNRLLCCMLCMCVVAPCAKRWPRDNMSNFCDLPNKNTARWISNILLQIHENYQKDSCTRTTLTERPVGCCWTRSDCAKVNELTNDFWVKKK